MTLPTLARGTFAALALATSLGASAQVLYLPPNVILPNNEGLAIGALGGLEGNAFTARVSDSTSGWFNPAGLAAAPASSASVSAGTFRYVTVSNDAAADSSGSSLSQVPAAVGFVLKTRSRDDGLTYGFSVARTAAWSQSTEAQILAATAPGRSYTTFSADASFNRTTVAIAGALKGGGTWKFGGGLLADILNLRNVQAVSYRTESGTAVNTSVGSFRATGGQGTLRLGLGAQAEISSDWKVGATVRTPGLRIFPSGVYAFDIVGQRGAASEQASFFDSEADFEYKLPWEGVLGIAWVRPAFEVELNVKGQTGYSAYEGFASTQKVIRISAPANGGPAVITTTPFPGLAFESRAILNVSLGGFVRLDEKGTWKLHAGFATDQSPVGDGDRFFNQTSLTNVTIGVSGTAFHIAGSLGFSYQFGTTGELTVPDISGGTLARSTFKVSNFGVLYSVSYVF